jgi:hypothetical protein
MEPIACASPDFMIDPREAVVAPTVHPALDDWGKPRQNSREAVDKLGSDNDMLGRHNIDAVGQGVAGEIGADERNDAANARNPEPDRHVFWAIRHEQTDDITDGEALSQRPTRISIRSLQQGPICQALPGGKESGRIAELVGSVFNEDREGNERI